MNKPRESAWSYFVTACLFLAGAAFFTSRALAAVSFDHQAGWARFVMWGLLALAFAGAPAALARIKPKTAGSE